MMKRLFAISFGVLMLTLAAATNTTQDHECVGCKFRKVGPSSTLSCLSVTTGTFWGQSGTCTPSDSGCDAEGCFAFMRARIENNCPGRIYIGKKTHDGGCTPDWKVLGNPNDPDDPNNNVVSPAFYGSIACGGFRIYRAYLSSGQTCGQGNAVGQVGYICTSCDAVAQSPDPEPVDPSGD